MEHLAILKKEWKLLEKVLSREKKIESRWYKAKYAPWGRIKRDDKVYFKESGGLVTAKAEVKGVLQFSNLNPKKARDILDKYGISIGIRKEKIPEFVQLFKAKKYCILIFLKNPQKINPFKIDRTGFGSGAAWISVSDIEEIKVNR